MIKKIVISALLLCLFGCSSQVRYLREISARNQYRADDNTVNLILFYAEQSARAGGRETVYACNECNPLIIKEKLKDVDHRFEFECVNKDSTHLITVRW